MNRCHNPGDKVYLCWYDFSKEKEYILQGEVVDNSLYAGTQWQDFVNVRLQPEGMSAPICHSFLPERLSKDSSNVPHDDCFLICGNNAKVKYQQKKDDNPWLTMTQFKNEHWDAEHNHISVDALDEFYRLWSIAINWRIGMMQPQELKKIEIEAPSTPAEAIAVPTPKKSGKYVELDLFA